jgi:hypothetical protein
MTNFASVKKKYGHRRRHRVTGNKNGKKQGEMESVGGKFAVFLSFVVPPAATMNG